MIVVVCLEDDVMYEWFVDLVVGGVLLLCFVLVDVLG